MPSDDDDSFWDELGFSWRASVRDAESISRRLGTRLKIQSVLVTGAIVLGAALSLLGFALAAWTLWIGWITHTWNFLTRGATIGVVSFLAAMATFALVTRNGVETRSVREMLQVLSARTERLIRAADLGCYSMVVVAIGATIGSALRIRFGHPAAMPLWKGLLDLAVVWLALFWYRSSQARALRRYRHLQQAFSSGDELH